MKLTQHAEKRWQERFPDCDVSREFEAATRVGKGTKRKIQKIVTRPVVGPYRGYHFLLAPCGAVFVVGRRDLIVTVYPPLVPA